MPNDPAFVRPLGSGEMAAHIRALDWSLTPLGPIENWPQSLKTIVNRMLASGHAMCPAWGSERTLLYNDPYVPRIASGTGVLAAMAVTTAA